MVLSAARSPTAREDQHDDPEGREREHRRHDERDREPGPEAQPRGRLRFTLVVSHRASLVGLPGVATSR